MKITCIQLLNSQSTITKSEVLALGKTYIVYALLIDVDGIWFCILDEARSSPMWHPECCFKIEDPRLSKYWIFNSQEDLQGVNQFIFAFPEWVNGQSFHWDLLEDDETAWQIFRQYERLMNQEFPDPSIVETAQIGDDKWLICPLCIDAWESQSPDALVECPKCHHLYNNPRFRDELPSYKAWIR